MTLRQLRYAVEVNRMGSFGRASKALYISQSSLSFAIRELEREIGILLFERSQRGIRPTEEGTVFLGRAREILQAVENLEEDYISDRPPVSRLRIHTVQSSIVPGVVSRLAAELEHSEAPMRLRCKMCSTNDVIDALTGDECDVGIIYCTDRQDQAWQGIFDAKGLEVKTVFEAELFIILHKRDKLAQYPYLELGQLSDHTFVFSGDDGLDSFSNLADYRAAHLDLNEHPRYIDAQDSLLLNQLLRENKTFSVAHKSPLQHYYGDLAYVSHVSQPKVQMLFVRPSGRSETPEMKRLFDLLTEEGQEINKKRS